MVFNILFHGGELEDTSPYANPEKASSCFTTLSQGFVDRRGKFRLRRGYEPVFSLPEQGTKTKCFRVGDYVIIMQFEGSNVFVSIYSFKENTFIGEQNRNITVPFEFDFTECDTDISLRYRLSRNGILNRIDFVLITGAATLQVFFIYPITKVWDLREVKSDTGAVFPLPASISTWGKGKLILSGNDIENETRLPDGKGRGITFIIPTLKLISGTTFQEFICSREKSLDAFFGYSATNYKIRVISDMILVHGTSGMYQVSPSEPSDIAKSTFQVRRVSSYLGAVPGPEIMRGQWLVSPAKDRLYLKTIKDTLFPGAAYTMDREGNQFSKSLPGDMISSLEYPYENLIILRFENEIKAVHGYQEGQDFHVGFTTFFDASMSGFDRVAGVFTRDEKLFIGAAYNGTIYYMQETNTLKDTVTDRCVRHQVVTSRFKSGGSKGNMKVFIKSKGEHSLYQSSYLSEEVLPSSGADYRILKGSGLEDSSGSDQKYFSRLAENLEFTLKGSDVYDLYIDGMSISGSGRRGT